jgi:hypothetical protein
LFRFFIPAAALTFGLPPAVNFLARTGCIGGRPSFLHETTWLVAFITSVIFVYLYRLNKPSFFVQLYLLSMAIKLMASFAFNLLMVIADPAGAVPNVLYFLAVYIGFTTLEIACLYRRISGRSAS